jgi:hypothetical protein
VSRSLHSTVGDGTHVANWQSVVDRHSCRHADKVGVVAASYDCTDAGAPSDRLQLSPYVTQSDRQSLDVSAPMRDVGSARNV